VHENRAECLFSLLKPYLRVFRGISKANLPGYLGFLQFLRNFRQLTAFEPTFKGVWSTVVNFALWPPPDTKPGQYPQPHKRSDDSLGRHALGGWAYCPQRSVRVSLA